MLTADRLRELLDYDLASGVFTWRVARRGTAAGTKAGYVSKAGYVQISVDGKLYQAHRLAHLYVTGHWSVGLVDHTNGVAGDDGWGNLRPATQSQNLRNCKRRRDNTSGVKGVSYDKARDRWVAYIADGRGALVNLGRFHTLEEAAAARQRAADRHYGDFARHA
jgi:hypothetical protein